MRNLNNLIDDLYAEELPVTLEVKIVDGFFQARLYDADGDTVMDPNAGTKSMRTHKKHDSVEQALRDLDKRAERVDTPDC